MIDNMLQQFTMNLYSRIACNRVVSGIVRQPANPLRTRHDHPVEPFLLYRFLYYPLCNLKREGLQIIMINLHHVFTNIPTLTEYLRSQEIRSVSRKSSSILIQVFTSHMDQEWIGNISHVLESELPTAVRIGCTSAGEIAQGRLYIETTILSFSFFEEARITPIAVSCIPGDEFNTGKQLREAIHAAGQDIAGVLLLATPLTINGGYLLQGMFQNETEYPVFGGGAGVYNSAETSLVFSGNDYMNHGVVAVVFLSKNLHIFSRTYLGWHPLSKEMTITETDGMRVITVDGENAFEVYYRYLNIPNDSKFFMNALEFPFLLERGGETITRVPFSVDQSGAIQFAADLNEGEKFRIGYGNPDTIIHDAIGIHNLMNDFDPDAIFLYSCICRRFLMQKEIDLETLPFNTISPTVGFYTYGEFFGSKDKIRVLNSTMVAVGMREGDNRKRSPQNFTAQMKAEELMSTDPYANKHSRIVSRLVHFISVVTSELEEANKELTKIAEIDKLTKISNRLKLDVILELRINEAERYNEYFSVIVMDIDFFKRVNDTYGHNIGDVVLTQMANILRENVRSSDTVGRWGGEEFLLILPHTTVDDACIAAEKIRTAIASEIFEQAQHLTCSFGVAGFQKGDNADMLVGRSDKALYKAKNNGRNRVCRFFGNNG